MKPEEVRLGNLVKLSQDTIWKIEDRGKIEEVNLNNIKGIIFHNEDNRLYEPVPITVDLLIQFGFRLNDEKNWDNGRMELSQKGEHKFRFMQGWTNVELKYIHQLQNLYYALTEKELSFVFITPKKG